MIVFGSWEPLDHFRVIINKGAMLARASGTDPRCGFHALELSLRPIRATLMFSDIFTYARIETLYLNHSVWKQLVEDYASEVAEGDQTTLDETYDEL